MFASPTAGHAKWMSASSVKSHSRFRPIGLLYMEIFRLPFVTLETTDLAGAAWATPRQTAGCRAPFDQQLNHSLLSNGPTFGRPPPSPTSPFVRMYSEQLKVNAYITPALHGIIYRLLFLTSPPPALVVSPLELFTISTLRV